MILSTGDVAKLLEVSTEIVRDLVDKGVIASEPRLTARSRRRIRRAQLEAFAQDRGITLDWSLLENDKR